MIVTLGLDPKGFSSGAKKAKGEMADLSDSAQKRAKEIERAGAQAAAFFSKLRNEALALAGVFTAGMGIKSFIESTIGSAINLGYMAQNLKMSTQDLGAWQRAAQRAGGTAEGITAQLKESALELANVKMGRGSEAATEFYRQGGIDVRNFKDGNEFLLARSRILHDIYSIDPTRALLVAQRMGITEDNFNLLKQGPEAVRAMIDQQLKQSKVTEEQTKKAQELYAKWLDFKQGFETTFMQIVLNLAPAITTILKKLEGVGEELQKWIGDGKDVNKWIDDFINTNWDKKINEIKEFAREVRGIVNDVKELVQTFKGWKTDPIAKTKEALGKSNEPLAANAKNTIETFEPLKDSQHPIVDMFFGGALRDWIVDKLDKGKKQGPAAKFNSSLDKAKYATKRLMDSGWSQAQAAGIVGSLMQESQLQENAVNPESGAYGVAQWLDKSRIAAFEKWAGRPLKGSSFDQQLDFMNYEMTKGAYKNAGNAIRGAKNAEDAAVLHRKLYEQPGEDEANDKNRKAFGRVINQKMSEAMSPPVSSVDSRSYMKAFSPVGANSVRGNVSTNDVTINGDITVHTKATDAAGIADGLRLAIQERLMPSQSNTGLT